MARLEPQRHAVEETSPPLGPLDPDPIHRRHQPQHPHRAGASAACVAGLPSMLVTVRAWPGSARVSISRGPRGVSRKRRADAPAERLRAAAPCSSTCLRAPQAPARREQRHRFDAGWSCRRRSDRGSPPGGRRSRGVRCRVRCERKCDRASEVSLSARSATDQLRRAGIAASGASDPHRHDDVDRRRVVALAHQRRDRRTELKRNTAFSRSTWPAISSRYLALKPISSFSSP